MKRQFSLVELLTVIVIMLVLIGLALGAYATVTNKVRIAKTKARMKSIEVAISSYRTQYNILPFTAQAGTADNFVVTDTSTPSIANLLDTLSGRNTILNPRGISFIELDADGTFRDSWSEGTLTGFTVVLDLDYDSLLFDTQVAGEGDLQKEFVVWSKGRDGQDDIANDGEEVNKDNVKSWKE